MQSVLIINGLSGFLIATALLVILTPKAVTAARFYALQSLILVILFVLMASASGSQELYTWAATSFVTKVLLVPMIMFYAFRKIDDPTLTDKAVLPPALSIVGAALIVIGCFAVIEGVTLPGAAGIKPALAISLAHFFLGLGCIVTQRSILKQVFGYCLMENGSHLTLALLAPNAPELVEVGITTDAIFAVVIMTVLATRISHKLKTVDARKLTTLRG